MVMGDQERWIKAMRNMIAKYKRLKAKGLFRYWTIRDEDQHERRAIQLSSRDVTIEKLRRWISSHEGEIPEEIKTQGEVIIRQSANEKSDGYD